MTVTIGFLGCGFIARYHSAMLAAPVDAGAARVAAVFDPDTDRAAAFAASHGAIAARSEHDVIEACQAVYVTTWTSEHRRLVEQVAAAGRAVFVEKPLAFTAAEAQAMAVAVERAGVANQVGLVLRDSPSFLLLRHLVQRPCSGRIMSIVFRDDQFLPVQGQYGSTWRGDAARAGAGTLLEHSIHDLDLLRWIAGPLADVSARTAAFHGIEGIEDVATVSLAFASGALSTLTSVWHDVLARPSLRHVEVLCERAHYLLAGDADGPVSWTVEAGANGPGRAAGAAVDDGTGPSGSVQGADLRRLVADLGLVARNPDAAFVAAVAAGTPAYPDIATAVPAHVAADAAYRSAATGGVPVSVA